jgi:hypothetical protein
VSELLRTFLHGSWSLLFKVFIIVVPIMIVLEIFEGTRPFQAMVRGWSRVVGRRLGMEEEVAAPTLIGFLFGIAYGGGVIVRATRSRDLSRRQVFLMSVFLSMVHAIFEDSLVFIAVGASAIWVVGFRLVWAAAVTLLLGGAASWWIRHAARR